MFNTNKMNKFCHKLSAINHKLIIVGTNHKYSPIEIREKVAFSKQRLKDALRLLKENYGLKGAIILSTCNRVEIYASAEDYKTGIEDIKNFLCAYQQINRQELFPCLYIYEGKETVRHLLSVACGLDSLILGETEILGQVEKASLEAKNAGFVDENLESVFNYAINFAKEIHQKTKISENKVSIGSVAIDFIKEKLGELSNKNILIIGTGKVTELFLEYLNKEKTNVVFISNRTFQKASQLAKKIGAEAVRFDELNKYLNKADIVITAARSPHFIIRKNMLDGLIKNRLLIIDLALPRNVEPQVKEINSVELFYFEDFSSLIKKNTENKSHAEKVVNVLIERETEKIWPAFTKLELAEALLP